MKWTYPKSVIAVLLTISATQSLAIQSSRTIYGLANAQHFQAKQNGAFYIQLGSFSNKFNAANLEKSARAKTKFPVMTHQKNGNYVVTVGPINSAAEVRSAGYALVAAAPRVRQVASRPVKPLLTPYVRPIPSAASQRKVKQISANQPVAHNSRPAGSGAKQGSSYQNKPWKDQATKSTNEFLAPLIPTKANWYASLGVGGEFPTLNSSMSVNNGSGFPPPNGVDLYSTSNNSQVLFGASLGRRWQNESVWLPSLSVGVLYEYFFPTNAGGTIMQYSLPAFTNYNYQWNISSNVVMATGKLNLFQYNRFSPYITGGVGGGFNRATSYREQALPGVTSRVSPGFADNTNSQFAYNAGAGLDFQFAPQFILSVGYLYQDLGAVASGPGFQTWSGESLNLGSYRSNDVFASVSYLFGQ